MGIVLDTSVLIAAEKGAVDLETLAMIADPEPVIIAAITASELLHGVERAKPASVKERRSQFIEGILASHSTAVFGLDEARCHARVWAEMASRGVKIGEHDLLIAATALSLDFSVATLNEWHFKRVPGLRLFPVPNARK